MRYKSINRHLKERFGEKVYKVSLNAGVTCPVRDGKKGTAGCLYCNPLSGLPDGSGYETKGIRDELLEGIEYIKKRHKARGFISYFQQYTNTYAGPAVLRKKFYDAIDHPDVVGLAVSTRPDSISDETLQLLSEINKKIFMWVELGLQSANNETLKFLNRGHTVEDFIDAVRRLHEENISVCAHVIIGLPDETETDILEIARLLNELKIEGVKIHNLHVLKDTPLEKLYNEGRIKLLSLREYSKRVALLLEHLSEEIIIHRFNSHAPRKYTIAPEWSVNKIETFNEVERELKRQDTWQGKKLTQMSPINPADDSDNP